MRIRAHQIALSAMAALALLPLAPAPALAQSDGGEAVIEEIFVIGSRLPARSATDTAVPVDVINAEEIDDTGARETGRAIQAAAPSFNFSSSTVSDGTDSLRPATLRGLGPDQTLVLVNGRRRHQGALIHVNTSVGRGTAGVDMNALPIGAIGRVEILRDGASAQYGSDAMAGVINLVLKNDGDGRVHFDYGQYSEGDGVTPHLWWHDGWEIGDGGIVTLTLDYRDREATHRGGIDGSRHYPWRCTSTGSGDTLFYNLPAAELPAGEDPTPGYNEREEYLKAVCGSTATDTDFTDFRRSDFNGEHIYQYDEFSRERDIYRIGDADSTQLAAVANLELPLFGSWDLLAFMTYSSREGQHGGFYRKPSQADRSSYEATLRVPEGETAPANPYADGFLPLINPTTDDLSFSVGLTGDITDNLSVDIAYTTGENTYDFHITNSINFSYFGVAEDGGALVRRTEQVYNDQLTGLEVTEALEGPRGSIFEADSGGLTYEQTTLDADFIWVLSDNLGVAFGLQSRQENFSIRAGEDYSWADYGGYNFLSEDYRVNPGTDPDDYSDYATERAGQTKYSAAIQVFPGFSPQNVVDEGRDALSLYGEVDFSGDNWRAAGALRYEDYSDFGDVFTLKVAGRYGSDEWAVRGALSTGFRAPSLHQLYFSLVATLFGANADGVLVPKQTGTFRNDSKLADDLGIPDLTEETSLNLSLGAIWSPESIPLDLTFDIYQIDISDRVLLSSSLDRTDSDLPPGIQSIIQGVGADAAQLFYNAGDTSTFGYDLILSYDFNFGNMDLDLSFSYNYTDTTVDSVTVPAGLQGVTVDKLYSNLHREIIENWQPQTRANIVADLSGQSWKFYAAMRHIGEYNFSGTSQSQTISASQLLDVRFTYELDSGLKFMVGGDNILDVYPDTIQVDQLKSRAGPLTAVDGTTIVSDNGGIFPYPRGAAPFGINGAYFYFGLEYRY